MRISTLCVFFIVSMFFSTIVAAENKDSMVLSLKIKIDGATKFIVNEFSRSDDGLVIQAESRFGSKNVFVFSDEAPTVSEMIAQVILTEVMPTMAKGESKKVLLVNHDRISVINITMKTNLFQPDSYHFSFMNAVVMGGCRHVSFDDCAFDTTHLEHSQINKLSEPAKELYLMQSKAFYPVMPKKKQEQKLKKLSHSEVPFKRHETQGLGASLAGLGLLVIGDLLDDWTTWLIGLYLFLK